jgi:hypothetical protein
VTNVPGGHTGGAPPVPIPNTEVKPSKADATAAARLWESRTLPGYNEGPLEKSSGPFFLLRADYDRSSHDLMNATFGDSCPGLKLRRSSIAEGGVEPHSIKNTQIYSRMP